MVIIGAVVGMVVAFFVGTIVARAAASFDEPTGWEGLTSIAVAMVGFVPIGAFIGAMSGTRFHGEPFWRGLGPARLPVIVGAVGAVVLGGLIGWIGWGDSMSVVTMAVWSMPVGGVVGHVVQLRRQVSRPGF
jgi:hypothetical protein